MEQRTHTPAQQPTPEPPDLTPRPSPILAGPTTVEQCQQDYANAADVRERLDEQINGGDH